MQQQSSSRMPKLPAAGTASSSVSRLNDRSRALRKEIARTNPDKDLRPRLEEYHPGAEHGEGPKSYFATLRNDWNRRQAAYEAREAEYHARVLELEEEIEQARAAGAQAPAADPRVVDRAFLELHDMHETVVSNLERSEDRTTKILREQERSLMRAFRARVHDTNKELSDVRPSRRRAVAPWRGGHAGVARGVARRAGRAKKERALVLSGTTEDESEETPRARFLRPRSPPPPLSILSRVSPPPHSPPRDLSALFSRALPARLLCVPRALSRPSA